MITTIYSRRNCLPYQYHRLPYRRSGAQRGQAIVTWLVRTALATGDNKLTTMAVRTAKALASDNPGFPAITAAAAHSLGLAGRTGFTWPRPPRSTMTRGPRPPRQKTSPSCTPGMATRSRPSITSTRHLADTS
jgi:hypothetical protein